MLLDLNFPFKNLSSADIENSNAGKALANILAIKAPGVSPIKAYDWALKLFNGGKLELDTADRDSLKAIVEQSEELTVMAKAQMLAAFRKQADNAPAKKEDGDAPE